jgi:hypothetical protein
MKLGNDRSRTHGERKSRHGRPRSTASQVVALIDAGDIYLADLGFEQRHPVVVLSPASISRIAGRIVVAPAALGPADEVPSPWRIDGFAIDLMTTTSPERLLTHSGRIEARGLRQMLVAARQLL